MSIKGRKEARKHLAGLLTAALDSAQVVSASGPEKLRGQTPVVYLSSSGTDRTRETSQGFYSYAFINIHILVRRSKEEDDYTTADAEDILDDLEKEVAIALDNAQSQEGYWSAIDYDARSNADRLVVEDGIVYIHEEIAVKLLLD